MVEKKNSSEMEDSKKKRTIVQFRERKRFSCDECGKFFHENAKLKRHKLIHTKTVSFECDVCQKSFTRKDNLDMHKRRHSMEKPFNCEYCKEGFYTKVNILRHMITHTNEKPYSCEICKKSFTTKFGKMNHDRIHKNKRLFQCDQCGTGYTEYRTLVKHKLTHLEKNPYECDKCVKKFRHKYLFDKHKLAHDDNKLVVCEECKKSFQSKAKLLKHVCSRGQESVFESVSENDDSDFEPRSFRSRTKAVDKDRQVENKKKEKSKTVGESGKKKMFKCQICGRNFANQNWLTKHMKEKNKSCKEEVVSKKRKKVKKIDEWLPQCIEHEDSREENYETCQSELSNIQEEAVVQKIGTLNVEEIAKPLPQSTKKHDDLIKENNDQMKEEPLNLSDVNLTEQIDGMETEITVSEFGNSTFSLPKVVDHSIESKFEILSKRRDNYWSLSCVPLLNAATMSLKHVIWVMKANSFAEYTEFLKPIVTIIDVYLLIISDKNVVQSLKEGTTLMDVELLANSKDEVIARFTSYHDNPVIKSDLQKCLNTLSPQMWNLKSVYFKVDGSRSQLIYGVDEIEEKVGGLELPLDGQVLINSWSLEICSKIIDLYLEPTSADTLLEIGCINGPIGLLLSHKCEFVVEFDDSPFLESASRARSLNNITNADFVRVSDRTIQLTFEEARTFSSVIGIINQNTRYGFDPFIMKELRELTCLRRLVVITSLTKECLVSLGKLTESTRDGSKAFVPIRYCKIETKPESSRYNYVILMLR